MNALYLLQEEVLSRLMAIEGSPLESAKLCGGTALSRCWLNHRISYDLDFFLPEGFSPLELSIALKKAGIKTQDTSITTNKFIANQMHTTVVHGGELLKVSFIEDSYYDLYPVQTMNFGSLMLKTEGIDGLYHRKLRTVSGRASEGDQVIGGRQTARDLFDLYVLSHSHAPLLEQIENLPYDFPGEAFIVGLTSMPWFNLQAELSEIVCNEVWVKGKDISELRDSLMSQIGANEIDEDWDSDGGGKHAH